MTEPADLKALEDKLTAARTRLILDQPFLGALVLHLPLQAANPAWCPTTGTDARHFYYNPDYIRTLRADETRFVLAHEALHCALSHFARRQHRVRRRWDPACDYAINPILVDEGLTPPPGMLMLKEYAGLSAEEIYPLLDDNDLSETLDRHLYDKDDNPAEGGQDSQENPLDQRSKRKRPPDQNTGTPDQGPSGQPRQLQDQPPESGGQSSRAEPAADTAGSASPPPPLSHQEAEALAVQWQQRLAGAARQARQAGKLSGVMQRLVEELLQPRLPWRQLLAHYLTSLARDDYSHTRPSSRRGDPAIFPTLRSRQLQAVVALDVSGSVSDRELQECLSEINAIKGQVHAGITLIACDAAIVDGFPRRFEPWEEITLPPRIAGGGHTDFRPVFDWIDTQDQAPDLLLFFTDALGDFPAQAPHYPVLWLIKGRGQPPFGVRVALNG